MCFPRRQSFERMVNHFCCSFVCSARRRLFLFWGLRGNEIILCSCCVTCDTVCAAGSIDFGNRKMHVAQPGQTKTNPCVIAAVVGNENETSSILRG